MYTFLCMLAIMFSVVVLAPLTFTFMVVLAYTVIAVVQVIAHEVGNIFSSIFRR